MCKIFHTHKKSITKMIKANNIVTNEKLSAGIWSQ